MALLKAAVIGTGNIGFHHSRIYSTIKQVDLIGVFDTNNQKSAKVSEAFNVPVFQTIEELFEAKPDLVSICVPSHLHYELAKLCLENGIHCLVEKPLCTELDQITSLIEIANRKKLVLLTGHIERFNPAVIELKSLIKSGKLGHIVNIVSKRVGGYPPQLSPTGVYYDLAVHDLDIILYLMGEEPELLTTHKLKIFNSTVDDTSSVFLQFKESSAFIQVNWITPVKIRTLAVTGTKGYAELNFINQSIHWYERNADPENFEEKDFHEFLHKFSQPQKTDLKIEKAEPLMNEITHFINVVIGNETLVVTPESVYQVMKWLINEKDAS